METDLTKKIKNATHTYRPKMSCKKSKSDTGRTIRYADEVWTPHGIVDSIRFEDYVVSRKEYCKKISCKITGETFPNKHCKGCMYIHREAPVTDMCITAFEIKITKSDFLSKNGHNIDHLGSPIGNENYYCVPKKLVSDIEQYVPEHCGILVWTGNGLREYRKALWLYVPDNIKVKLLYNALKKWVDGCH